jgi:plasmid stability protein
VVWQSSSVDSSQLVLQNGGRLEEQLATLNVENLPDALYRKLKRRARERRRSVSQEVIRILEEAVDRQEELSILDLHGLGKKAWHGVDAAAHVEAEREAWD